MALILVIFGFFGMLRRSVIRVQHNGFVYAE